MKRILIADASKASLVMTSEVFKDHFPGVQVVVARTSADAIELAKSAGELDAFIIDYDLPDRDGAFTAARLKKMFSQPILITAFDRPDVHESIDRDLAAFDDCLSWLKKPVKPELVVSLAQRFIEGQHRCQRRVNCSLPAFLEVEFVPALRSNTVRVENVARVKVVAKGKGASKTSSKTNAGKNTKNAPTAKKTQKPKTTVGKPVTTASKVKAKAQTAAPAVSKGKKPLPVKVENNKTLKAKEIEKKSKGKAEVIPALTPVRKFIPVVIDDVSLGGAKIRVNNSDLVLNVGKTKGAQLFCDFREGQILNVHVPPSHLILAGSEALEKWQKAEGKNLAETLPIQSKDKAATTGKNAKSSTLGGLAQQTRTVLTKAEGAEKSEPATQGNVLRAEVRWTGSNETFTFCGLRSETVNMSKKLFESMIEIEARSRAQLSPMVSPNIPRNPKLNA